MALINCPECTVEVSDRAPTCPKCGSPIAIKEQLAPQPSRPANNSREIDVSAASGYHRFLIISILVWFFAVIFLRSTPGLFNLVMFALVVSNVYCSYKLASALGFSPVLWLFLCIFGLFIACIPQMLLINSANKIFKSMGLKIGFLGGASRPA